ncbi:MAG: undecaprenyl-diphosphate phosphatase [Gemmatimonadota bacterium]
MSPGQATFLGILQGLTEFLPVSSSGHLVLGQALLGLELPGVFFEVILHLGTLVSVVWVYRARLASLIHGALTRDASSWRYVLLLLLASVPAGLVGALGESFFEEIFGQPLVVAAFLLLTGAIVWTIRRTAPAASEPEPSAGQAVWIGVAQAAAILPGISRSGATVAAGAWRGVEVVRAAEFSFLLSIPAIVGAGILQLGEFRTAVGAIHPLSLAAGFVAALLSGVLAIRVFVGLLRRRRFHLFSYYCWAVGATYLAGALFVPGLR